MHYINIGGRVISWGRRSNNKEGERAKIRKILESMKAISFDDSSAVVCAELYCELKSNPIGDYDFANSEHGRI